MAMTDALCAAVADGNAEVWTGVFSVVIRRALGSWKRMLL